MRVTSLSYVAEYVSTFFFVLVVLVSHGNPLWIGAALVFAIYMVSGLSGGHLNPAVSLTMWLQGTMRLQDTLLYMGSQALGGVSAYYAYQMTI